MQMAYQEAVNAIFKHKAKAHHHLQAYVSRKTGKTKWGGLEMWPVHVSPCTPPLIQPVHVPGTHVPGRHV